jgi:hypothetical protein
VAGSPQHATLVASTVTTLTFDKDWDRIEVVSDGTSAISCTFDGSTPTWPPSTGNHLIPAAVGFVVREPPSNVNTVVKLISAGAPTVAVTGL